MSETPFPPSESPAGGGPAGHPVGGTDRPRWHGRLVASLVLLFVALAGVLSGIAIDRALLLPDRPFGRPGTLLRSRIGPFGAGESDRRARFERELGLTPAQGAIIDSIMQRQFAEIQEVQLEVRPRVQAIIEATRAKIDSLLTPEQRERFRTVRRRRMETSPRAPRGPGEDGREPFPPAAPFTPPSAPPGR